MQSQDTSGGSILFRINSHGTRILRQLEENGVIVTVNNFRGKARLPNSYIIPGFSRTAATGDTRGYDTAVRTKDHNLNQDIRSTIPNAAKLRSTIRPENSRDQACQVELARRLHRTLGWEMLMESAANVDRLCAGIKLGTITEADLEEVRHRYRLTVSARSP